MPKSCIFLALNFAHYHRSAISTNKARNCTMNTALLQGICDSNWWLGAMYSHAFPYWQCWPLLSAIALVRQDNVLFGRAGASSPTLHEETSAHQATLALRRTLLSVPFSCLDDRVG